MSLHVQQTEEAKAALDAQKRNTTISSIIIALLGLTLIGLILFIITMMPNLKDTAPIVSYNQTSDIRDELQKPEITNDVPKKPTSPSSSMSKVIASSAPSPASVPVPEFVAEDPSVDFGDGNDFGKGWDSGVSTDAGSEDASTYSVFGKTGGVGMTGHFYDLKHKRDGTPTKLGQFYKDTTDHSSRVVVYKDEIKKITRSRFSDKRMANYYKASIKLNFTNMVMKQKPADTATRAFKVEKYVDPSGWMITYEGELLSAPEGKFRFVGRYDDLLLVYINGRVVFDGSWSEHSNGFDRGKELPWRSFIEIPMRASRYVQFKQGDKIRIVIGESPGGLVGGCLLIQQKGKEYKKDSSGFPILPPFCTKPLRDKDKERIRTIGYPFEVDDVPVFPIQ